MNAPSPLTSMPTLIRGDARALPLPDECVDLVVTSPPYFGLRDYGTDAQIGSEATPADFIDALVECTREMMRVLKPSGSIFVNLGDKYAGGGGNYPGTGSGLPNGQRLAGTYRKSGRTPDGMRAKSLMLLPERYRIAAADELGLIARAVIVWSKPNGLPESVTDRVRRSHEDWVHLTKSPRYFAAVDEIREPHLHGGHGTDWNGRKAKGSPTHSPDNRHVGALGHDNRMAGNPLGKLPGSVWEIATQPLRVPAELGVDHFAAFPMEWPRKLILSWSPPDGVVLDPFSGTGTTALVATMLGRTGIGVDLSADYQRIAQWRCSDPKERVRAAGLNPDAVARVERVPAGQQDLFASLTNPEEAA